MAHDVFISYASADKPTADAVCATLEADGIRCFIAPRDITPGTDWSAAIVDAIEAARLMVLVFSSKANASPQISREVERAVSKGLPIIPFRIEDVLPARNLEYFLGTPHWLDAMSPPLERHLSYLTETVRFLLQQGERPAPGPIVRSRPAFPFKPLHLALGGGVAAIAVVLALVLGVFGGGESAAVEAALVGSWSVETPFSKGGDGSTTEWTVSLVPDGRYTARMTFRDAGAFTYLPAYGFAELRPAGAPPGTMRSPSWSVSGDTLMANSGAVVPSAMLTFISGSGALAGVAINNFLATPEAWQRASPAPAGAAWAGEWQRELETVNEYRWQMKIDVSPEGKYTFEAVIDDAGRLSAKDGAYNQVSENVGIQQGDYQVLDKDTIIFRNGSVLGNPLLAQVTWKRR